jgi:polyferredoxin
VHCTQCIDACDEIMVNIGKPTGLIRYSSQDDLKGKPRNLFRTRVVLYPIALAISLGLFAFLLTSRATTEVTLLRGVGTPWQMDGDRVVNQVRLKFSNRNREEHQYHVTLAGVPDAELVNPLDPFPVPGGHTLTTTVFVLSPRSAFDDGMRHVMFRVEDGHGFARNYVHPLLGPGDHARGHESHEGHEGEEHH